MKQDLPFISISDLRISYDDVIIQKDLSFSINNKDIFIIMGVSGCGKSTLLRCLIGLVKPDSGKVLYGGSSFWDLDFNERDSIMRRFGILYQRGALWSSMTLSENIALPLKEYSNLSNTQILDLVSFKLSLVGLSGYENYYPAEISGGMQKRAALARAIALDPDILFFDEPSAGLDPISSRFIDDLIIELNESLGATVIVVTHELSSIFSIGNNSIFLDKNSKTIIASGDPKILLKDNQNTVVRNFLTRGKASHDTHLH